MNKNFLYIDNNSTTCIDARVLSAMLPYFGDLYYNPSSSHHAGKNILKEILTSKTEIADLLKCDTDEIVFTSGATESINWALKGLALASQNSKMHILTAATEHKAVLDTCKFLGNIGFEIEFIEINNDGEIVIEDLRKKIRKDTLLISIMWANNETGTIQPIAEIGNIANERNVFFVCDATQTVGKVPIDMKKNNIDILCFSGHKYYGPKGIGAIAFNSSKIKSDTLLPQIHGGGQQNGLRSGTFNVPSIIGLGKASKFASEEMSANQDKISTIHSYFEEKLQEIPNVIIHGKSGERLYNTTNFYVPGIEADIFIGINQDIAISNGSACNSALLQPSHVLSAMGIADEVAMNSLRVSFGKFNEKEDADYLLEKIKNYIN